MSGQVHRFGDCAGLSAGTGPTVYLSAREAEKAGRALLAVARSIRRERFADSAGLTVSFEAADETWKMPPRLDRLPDGRAKRCR